MPIMRKQFTNRRVTQSDLSVVLATRGALKKTSRTVLDDFVGSHPTAQVQDVSDALLSGLVLEAKGYTSRGYQMVYQRLMKARRRLGILPPRKHSVARRRPKPETEVVGEPS